MAGANAVVEDAAASLLAKLDDAAPVVATAGTTVQQLPTSSSNLGPVTQGIQVFGLGISVSSFSVFWLKAQHGDKGQHKA